MIQISDHGRPTLYNKMLHPSLWVGLRVTRAKISLIDKLDHLYYCVIFTVQKNILQIIKRREFNWIGLISHNNCLLAYVTEGKIVGMIEVTGIRGRKLKQLLDDLKEKR
jgi:hypothetical protein